MHAPSSLMTLPNGTRVAPAAVRLIDARELVRPYRDHSGQTWPALVTIETRGYIVRIPCASLAGAEAMRDEIASQIEHARTTGNSAREDQRRGDVRRASEAFPPAFAPILEAPIDEAQAEACQIAGGL